jgi:hypothetical protein
MPAKDYFHDHVCTALEKDGWTITDDPLTVKWLGTTLQVDIGAERIVAAEKEGRKIAVEIKSFLRASKLEDLKDAIGQFIIYRSALKRHSRIVSCFWPFGTRRLPIPSSILKARLCE